MRQERGGADDIRPLVYRLASSRLRLGAAFLILGLDLYQRLVAGRWQLLPYARRARRGRRLDTRCSLHFAPIRFDLHEIR